MKNFKDFFRRNTPFLHAYFVRASRRELQYLTLFAIMLGIGFLNIAILHRASDVQPPSRESHVPVLLDDDGAAPSGLAPTEEQDDVVVRKPATPQGSGRWLGQGKGYEGITPYACQLDTPAPSYVVDDYSVSNFNIYYRPDDPQLQGFQTGHIVDKSGYTKRIRNGESSFNIPFIGGGTEREQCVATRYSRGYADGLQRAMDNAYPGIRVTAECLTGTCSLKFEVPS